MSINASHRKSSALAASAVTALLLGFASPLALPAMAHADPYPPVLKPYDPATVTVAGRAELYLPPDQARVSISFYAPGRSAAEATKAVSDRIRAYEAAVKGLGAPQVIFERTDLAVRPVMKSGADKKPDAIRGYEANGSVTVLIKDLAILPKVMDIAVNANPDNFSDVEFSIDDTAAARRKAREAAVKDAVEKARVYTEGAGHKLGRLLKVEEGGSNIIAQTGNRAIMAFAAPAMTSGPVVAAPNIAPEPQLYTAEVTLVYEIGTALPNAPSR